MTDIFCRSTPGPIHPTQNLASSHAAPFIVRLYETPHLWAVSVRRQGPRHLTQTRYNLRLISAGRAPFDKHLLTSFLRGDRCLGLPRPTRWIKSSPDDSGMSVSEFLQFPLRERLQIMDVMWEDLRKRADSFDIPQDHEDLLDGRRARIGTGQARILDWDSVKHSIGRACPPFLKRSRAQRPALRRGLPPTSAETHSLRRACLHR